MNHPLTVIRRNTSQATRRQESPLDRQEIIRDLLTEMNALNHESFCQIAKLALLRTALEKSPEVSSVDQAELNHWEDVYARLLHSYAQKYKLVKEFSPVS
jgi:hypothetical protein